MGLGIANGARVATLLGVVLLVACGSKGSPAAPPPVSETQFTARVDGVAWTPARAFVSSFAGNTHISAADASVTRLLSFTFSGPAKAGIHKIEYIEDLPVAVTYFEGAPNGPGWTSFAPNARGEVNLTSVTERSVAGTFSVVLAPLQSTTPGMKTLEGTFNIARLGLGTL